MQAYIEQQLKTHKKSEILELYFDRIKATSLEGLDEEFVKLEKLSMNGMGLSSLSNLPTLPSLVHLELSDNKLSNGLDVIASKCVHLTTLMFGNNKIAHLSDLQPLVALNSLNSLDLIENPVVNETGYRDAVFKLIPSLEYLDGTDKLGNEQSTEGEYEEDEDSEDLTEHTDSSDQDFIHSSNDGSSNDASSTLFESDEDEPTPSTKRQKRN